MERNSRKLIHLHRKVLKKIKNLAIFLIISIYFIGMVFTFSGSLINQIQIVRHQNQIEKISKAVNLEFSLNHWNNFSHSYEIKFQNNYYDVISFEKINSRIIAKVVKDKCENETRILITKIFNKSKSPFSEKKKSNTYSKHLLQENNFIFCDTFIFEAISLKNLNNVLDSKTTKFINFQEKPPC